MNELSRRIGKFDSPESLLKAYESLSGEFTKRCQKLKETEKENERLKADAADPAKLKEYAKQALGDDSFVAEHILGDQSISGKVIENYLVSLKSAGVPGLLRSGSGEAVLTPPAKPRNLSDAKRLADIMMNS